MNFAMPLKKQDIRSEAIGDEVLLYHSEQRCVHVVNASAGFVWNLCDGAHTPEDIAKALAATYRVAEDMDVRRDVAEILQTFAELGLVA